jgi:hypothetical protein
MPCGCRKSKASVPGREHLLSAPRETARVAVYQIVVNGSVVDTTEDPTAAREAAKAPGASIRVGSRPVAPGEPATVG